MTQTEMLRRIGACEACGMERAEKDSRFGARCNDEAARVLAEIEAAHAERRKRDAKGTP